MRHLGQFIDQDTHNGLLAAGGHYAELYDTYFRHQSLEYVEKQGRIVEFARDS